jgi:gas vesicle protein
MKNLILAFVIGIVTGAVAILLCKPSPTPEPAGVVNRKAEALKSQIADLKQELVKAKKPATNKTPKAVVKSFTTDNENVDMEAIQSQMAKHMAQQVTNRVAAQLSTLRARLGLSPEQEEVIKEILTRKESSASGTSDIVAMALESVGKGNLNIGGLTRQYPESGNPDYDAEIRAALDEEQAASYDTFLADQRTNTIEIHANQRLAQLQQTLDLTPEQKDQAFSVFTDSAASQFNNPSLHGVKEEREILREILTPEQVVVYESTPQVFISGSANILNLTDLPGGAQSIKIIREVIEE